MYSNRNRHKKQHITFVFFIEIIYNQKDAQWLFELKKNIKKKNDRNIKF